MGSPTGEGLRACVWGYLIRPTTEVDVELELLPLGALCPDLDPDGEMLLCGGHRPGAVLHAGRRRGEQLPLGPAGPRGVPALERARNFVADPAQDT